MVRMRAWLYRRRPLVLVQVGAAVLLIALWRIRGYAAAAVLIPVLGMWSGFVYFCAVYYSSNSGHRSRNIGVNEFLVGLGSFAGLFVSEWFMKRCASDAMMYAVCAAALLVSAAAQCIVASRERVPDGG
jgi:hypothetical protein